MATLQKFKLLASQCAVAGSPTRSPTTSPVFQLRPRRKTLRMLLNRSRSRREEHESSDRKKMMCDESVEKKLISNKLKDLFVSSPPLNDNNNKDRDDESEVLIERVRRSIARRSGSPRRLSAAFRYRLLRRAWRPVLVTIPE